MLINISKRAFSTAGSLLTWGETTYGWGRQISNSLRSPNFVQGFKDVINVSTGLYHLTFLTNAGKVYSVGLGDNGRLGHNSTATLEYPQSIDFFTNNNIRIKQIASGDRHNLALSQDGRVYAWGYGGRSKLFNLLPFGKKESPLGNGLNKDSYVPVNVQTLASKTIKSITAGSDFSFALTQNGQVYGWGCGLHTHEINPTSYPRQIQEFKQLAHAKHAHIKKIKSASTFTITLLDNGKLYVIGLNKGGVFGTRKNPLVITDNSFNVLTQVNDDNYHGQKITNFQISGNSLIFQTDHNNVYYSGMSLKFKPQRFPKINKSEIKKIFATYDSVGVVDNQNKVYFINDQFIDEADKQGNVYVCQDSKLSGNILNLGGTYKLRYAIISN